MIPHLVTTPTWHVQFKQQLYAHSVTLYSDIALDKTKLTFVLGLWDASITKDVGGQFNMLR